ncbi:hypothetical protein FRC12_010482, partial [Ceratobasidium sp. 428]
MQSSSKVDHSEITSVADDSKTLTDIQSTVSPSVGTQSELGSGRVSAVLDIKLPPV